MKLLIEKPEDVHNLPWKGNYRDDAHLFDLINDYIRKEPDLRKRQEADRLASVVGMGIDCEIDPTYDPLESVACELKFR